MNITNETLSQLALMVEQSFLMDNIEKYVTEFETIEDIEIMSITACWLNIGIRAEGFNNALFAYNKFKEAGSPLQYVLNKSQNWTRYQYYYTKFTTQHTLHDWWQMMGKLYKIYSNGSTILAEVKSRLGEYDDLRDATLTALTDIFSGVKQMPTDTGYVPNKFVRFVMMMVRPRPIGTGIWTATDSEFNPTQTYIPLSSELINTISDNGLIQEPNMSWEFAKTLANYFNEVFPDDPAKGYLSLLGLHNKLHLINQ